MADGRAQLVLHLVGEVQPGDIPLSQAVTQQQYDYLRAGDDDPCEVVAEVAPGDGGRGWHYGEDVLRKIVEHVDKHSLNGMLGHQRRDDLGTEFPTPVTHWVGAKWENGRALFRGVVDKTAPDLKRWLRSGRVTQPSIFTDAVVDERTKQVVDLKPISIDWAPLGRAGMQTAHVIAVAEMLPGEVDPPPTTPSEGGPPPVPEVLTYSQIIARLKEDHTNPSDVLRDMQVAPKDALSLFTPQELAAALPAEVKAAVIAGSGEMKAAGDLVAEIAAAAGAPVGTTGSALVQLVKDEHAALDTLTRESLAAVIEGGVGEMQVPDAVRPILREKVTTKLGTQRGITRDQVKTVAGELMSGDAAVKALLDGHFGGGTPLPPTTGQSTNGQPKSLREQMAAVGFATESYRI